MADPALYDLVRMQTLSIGTVSTLALSLGVLGFRTFVEAGVVDGSTIHYAIEQTQPSPKRETCTGVYNAGAQTISRTTLASNNSDAPISIDSGGDAQIVITANSNDFLSNGIDENDLPDAYDTVTMPAIRLRLRAVPDIFDYVSSGTVITTSTDFTDAFNAAEEDAWNNNIRSLYVPYDRNFGFVVAGPQIRIRSGLTIYGDHPSMSQIFFTDLSGGFFWDAENFAGGGIQMIGLVGNFSGGNGDYMLRVGGNPTDPQTAQRFIARDVLITCDSGTVSYGIIVDGTDFPGESGGMRAPTFDNIYIFNSTAIAFDNRYVRSGMYNNINIFQASGNNEIMRFTGLADISGLTRTSVGNMITNLRCNDLIFDYAIDSHGAPVAVEVSVTCSVNCANTQLFGAIASFTNLGGATNQVFRQSTGAFTSANF